MNNDIDFKIDLGDGKYTYIRYKGGRQECIRHGKKLRDDVDLSGDNMVWAMADIIAELECILDAARKCLNKS